MDIALMFRPVLLGVLSVIMVSATSARASEAEIYRQLDLFANVYQEIKQNYVEELTDQKLVEKAIAGMLAELDPHSGYMPPEAFKGLTEQTKGEFGGLGIEVTMENGLVKVVSPIEDTPADRAGLQPGDLVVEIDSHSVEGMSLTDAVEKMRGPVGTKVNLKIFRESPRKTFAVTITRAKIQIRPVRSALLGRGQGLGYLRVSTFNEHTTEEALKHLKELVKANGNKPLSGIVLDLRNNPGGLLQQAVSLSDLFLTQGEVVSTRGRLHDQNQRYIATPGDVLAAAPVVALINGGSASASEIVAGALQDHRRGIVVGQKSFGKGSVQTVIPLPEGAGMRLTTARYYTPSDRSIQAEGIVPDIEIRPAKVANEGEVEFNRSEAALQGHLENKEGQPAGRQPLKVIEAPAQPAKAKADTRADKAGKDDKAEAAKPPRRVPSINPADDDYDFQLDQAVNILQGLVLLQPKDRETLALKTLVERVTVATAKPVSATPDAAKPVAAKKPHGQTPAQ